MTSGRTRGSRTPIALVVALTAIATVVIGCAPITSTIASGSAAPASVSGAVITNTLTVDGRERTYLLRAPERVDESAPLPLLLVIHGAGGNASKAETATAMTDLAGADGFIVAYPNGTQAADVEGEFAWNAGACCATPVRDGIDDVKFIMAAIADIQAQQPVDPDRIYVSGFSNGGMLSYRLACERPGFFAGVAVIAGALNVPECAASATSVLMIHGTADVTVPYKGGKTNERTAARFGQWTNASFSDAVDYWSATDGCGQVPFRSIDGVVTRLSFDGCADDTTVEVVTIADGGHRWPITVEVGFDASDLITEFFDLGSPVSTLAQ
jgi:polyhydroxybutyrate depolymerase